MLDGHHPVLFSSHLQPGMMVQARYSVDRKIYSAKIDALTPFGAKVTFVDYGNEEEVDTCVDMHQMIVAHTYF